MTRTRCLHPCLAVAGMLVGVLTAGATATAVEEQRSWSPSRMAAQQSTGGSSSAPEERWPWPLHPTPDLVAPFDPPEERYGPGHRGIDLAGSVGQRVWSATTGRVVFAGQVAGRGVVVIRVGDLRLTYEPVHVLVRSGRSVQVGTLLGRLQAAGSHCALASCLHVGVRQHEGYVDPWPFFGPRPVRLKRLDGGGSPGSASISADRASSDSDAQTSDVSADSAAGSRNLPSGWPLAGGLGLAGFAGVAAATARRRGQARG